MAGGPRTAATTAVKTHFDEAAGALSQTATAHHRCAADAQSCVLCPILDSLLERCAAPALSGAGTDITEVKSLCEGDEVQPALAAVQLGMPTAIKERWAGARARAVPAAQMDEHLMPGASTVMIPVMLTLIFSCTAGAHAL